MKPALRTVSSWLAVAVGLLVGFFALARFGIIAWLPVNHDRPGWLLTWIEYAGNALLGLAFLVGSIIALRDRKKAGTAFLVFMPLTVFCLAYPSAGYLVWHSDGSGWFEPPEIPTAIGLTVLFFLPIYVAVLLLRHRKRKVVFLLAFTLLLAGIVFARSRWSIAFLPPFAGWSALFLAFALFWRGTNQLGWPCLIRPRARSLSQRVAMVVLTCLVILCVDLVSTFGLAALGSSLFNADCSAKPIIVHPESAYHAVFTAKLVFVGRSSYPHAGDWGIGIVQERFWGLPRWPGIVLLTNNIYWKGETYFVDGSRGHGILTRILPIVDGRFGCSRTRPAEYAPVDLRVLQETPPTGARLVGYVRAPETFVSGLVPPTRPKFITGIKISATGPTGTVSAITDQTGIYQLDNLPPGDYTVELQLPSDKMADRLKDDPHWAKVSLAAQATVEHSFHLWWNGRIEGHITNASGKPVQAWITLSSPTTQLPGDVRDMVLSKTDGSYELKTIPPGRYIVMLKTQGDDPSAVVQYYPSKSRAEDAQQLELSEGQRITGIDFKVR